MTHSFIKNYSKSFKQPVVEIPGFDLSKAFAPANKLAKLGIEVELETSNALPTDGRIGVKAPKSKSSWVSKPDGSLRRGIEYVVNNPIYVEEVDVMVNGLYKAIEDFSTDLALSNRCSTHVHYNIGGLKVNSITSIIALWTAFEELLINYCGENRKSNHFAVSSSESLVNIERWAYFLESGSLDLTEGLKYTSMNLRTMRTLGSIEFRCGDAYDTAGPVIDWVKLVHGICDYAVQNFKNPQDMAYVMSETGGVNLLAKICHDAGIGSLMRGILNAEGNENADYVVMGGFRRVQSLCYSFPWSAWMPSFEKEYIPNPFEQKVKTEGIWRNDDRAVRAEPVAPRGRILDIPPQADGGRPVPNETWDAFTVRMNNPNGGVRG